MTSTCPRGYKPQTACWLLTVGVATFRYWRENIEPHPRRTSFSAGDLLAFRIIKVLIYKKHLSADLLSLFSFSMIFTACTSRSLDELTNQYLLLDESDHSIRFGKKWRQAAIENWPDLSGYHQLCTCPGS